MWAWQQHAHWSPEPSSRLWYFKEILITTHLCWITQPRTGRLLLCGSLQFLDLSLLWPAALGFREQEELDSQLSYRLFPPYRGEHGERHLLYRKPTVAADKESKLLRTRVFTGYPWWLGCATEAGSDSVQFFPPFLPLFFFFHLSSPHPRAFARPLVALGDSAHLKCLTDSFWKKSSVEG